jgi:hypothetical protein
LYLKNTKTPTIKAAPIIHGIRFVVVVISVVAVSFPVAGVVLAVETPL